MRRHFVRLVRQALLQIQLGDDRRAFAVGEAVRLTFTAADGYNRCAVLKTDTVLFAITQLDQAFEVAQEAIRAQQARIGQDIDFLVFVHASDQVFGEFAHGSSVVGGAQL